MFNLQKPRIQRGSVAFPNFVINTAIPKRVALTALQLQNNRSQFNRSQWNNISL